MTNAQGTTPLTDYFKLPFEVHYGEAVNVTMYEFKSDPEQSTGRFSDVKAVHMEQGRSFGLVLACAQNNGPELYCCITNSHDEVCPDWLDYVSENEIDFNYGTDYEVMVEGNEIKFVSIDDDELDEDSIDIDSLDYRCSYVFDAYHIAETSPEFIILDAENTRLKVNLEGYILDENNNLTSERVFDPLSLDEEAYEKYTTLNLWEAKFEWVMSTLEKDFPEDKHLKLSFDTE
jgi:hypothetical protein